MDAPLLSRMITGARPVFGAPPAETEPGAKRTVVYDFAGRDDEDEGEAGVRIAGEDEDCAADCSGEVVSAIDSGAAATSAADGCGSTGRGVDPSKD